MSCIYMTKENMKTTYKKVKSVLVDNFNNEHCCARYACKLLDDVMIKAAKWQAETYKDEGWGFDLNLNDKMFIEDYEPRKNFFYEDRKNREQEVVEAHRSFSYFAYQIEIDDFEFMYKIEFILKTLLAIYADNKGLSIEESELDWAN